MTDLRDDLIPDLPDDVVRLAERLRDERPLPHPGFRGALGRHLQAQARTASPPARLRALIAGYATAGSLLLMLGVASAAGAGPLG